MVAHTRADVAVTKEDVPHNLDLMDDHENWK
jgi:hypothetical protein